MPSSIPSPLVQAFADGNGVVMLGTASSFSRDLDSLAQTLAEAGNYPPTKTDRSFPAIAQYYQNMLGGDVAGRVHLVNHLRAWLEKDGARATALHRAVSALPTRRFVDFSYDDRLATALGEEKRLATQVLRDHELPYVDRSRVILLKPFGAANQPDSLVLTEEDHFGFARGRPLILAQLQEWMATRTLLFIGMDPTSYHFCALHRLITQGISPQHQRAFALVRDPALEAAWTALGITPLVAPDPTQWITDLTTAIAALPTRPAEVLPGPGMLLRRRPYKFLDYYTAADADLFFGREQGVDDLAGRALAHPMTVLFGRSGVGKTSLLLAGVVPRLEARGCWVIYGRPGEDPLEALRTVAEAHLEKKDLEALTEKDFATFLLKAGARLGKTPVVILDQAEECFTALSAGVRARWVTALAQALYTAPAGVHWMLSLREDFAAELHEWTRQIPTLFAQTGRLTPLTVEAAREAVARPPVRVGAEIEPGLVDRLIDEVMGAEALEGLNQTGVAPALLQIVCDRLYQTRDQENRMTLAQYETLGGARRILAEYVDVALAQLPLARREMAVALLKALVTGRETKLPLTPEEVLGGVEGDQAEKLAVLAHLINVRLVRSLDVGETRRYELAHDILVEKIRSWIDETEQAAKEARDLLRQEHAAWSRLQVLPEREKIAYLHAQRENPYLRLDTADLTLMLRAALREGFAPSYWTGRAAVAGLDLWPLLAPALQAPQETEQIHALWALTGWQDERALEALRVGMEAPSPRVRVAAHQALYHLGTPAALTALNASDDLRLVPAGTFLMGEENEAHRVPLEAYFAEKYPVTNEKYAQFIEAGGYSEPQVWTRAGWAWVQRVKRTQPAFWTFGKWNQAGYPVVGVAWYEAWAYTQWAGRRLLTEAEWEKAASWEGQVGDKGKKRVYPWGDEFDKMRCNTKEAGLGRTTPIGQYSPRGDSPYGCVDMAGNVWEWTSSMYRPYPYHAKDGHEQTDIMLPRVLRGGSWNDFETDARIAYRNNLSPDFANYGSNGFRGGVAGLSSHSLEH